jgi:toxin ParE1/3/4
VTRGVEFSPEALADLLDLYDYIAARDGAERAIGYIDRIEDCCRSLSSFPERGIRRDDLRTGLRVLGFERRAVIAFCITADTVIVLRILYGGRDLETVLFDPEVSF